MNRHSLYCFTKAKFRWLQLMVFCFSINCLWEIYYVSKNVPKKQKKMINTSRFLSAEYIDLKEQQWMSHTSSKSIKSLFMSKLFWYTCNNKQLFLRTYEDRMPKIVMWKLVLKKPDWLCTISEWILESSIISIL